MQVSFSSAYLRVSDRRAQAAGEVRQASEPQRFADMPDVTPVDTAALPAELQRTIESLRDFDVEYLQGLQSFRDAIEKSVVGWSEHIEFAESLIAKHGPNPRFLAMIDSGKSALRELATRIRDKDAEIARVTAELEEKMRAPAYQQWLSRQAAQSADTADAPGTKALVADGGPALLSVVC